MELRTANENEWKKVKAFYWQLIEQMDSALYKPGWKKGIYPTDEFLMDSIRNKELYVLLSESNYMASMILNHKCTDGYEKITLEHYCHPSGNNRSPCFRCTAGLSRTGNRKINGTGSHSDCQRKWTKGCPVRRTQYEYPCPEIVQRYGI